MSRYPSPIQYRLELIETAAGTGYFNVLPQGIATVGDGLAYLRRHPNDSFMHAHLLVRIGEMDQGAIFDLLAREGGSTPAVQALVLEAATVYPHLSAVREAFCDHQIQTLADQTPLVVLRSELLADQKIHRQWAQLFHDNHFQHRRLPPPASTGLPFPIDGIDGSDDPLPAQAHLTAIIKRYLPEMASFGKPRQSLEATIAKAISRLNRLEIFDGPEMRHQSSLSRYALLRKWRFDHEIKSGGANLNGKLAVLSALTETPYPYPAGPPSTPATPALPWLEFESLPNFSTGIPERDLMLLEKTLAGNGFTPIYVDITRKDLEIPVVKALIPGLEMTADFDRYCRSSPRLFNNYLKI